MHWPKILLLFDKQASRLSSLVASWNFLLFSCSLLIIYLHYKSKWGSRSHNIHLDSPCDMGILNPMSWNRLMLILILLEYLLTIIAGDRSSIALQYTVTIAASFNTTEKHIVALWWTNQTEVIISKRWFCVFQIHAMPHSLCTTTHGQLGSTSSAGEPPARWRIVQRKTWSFILLIVMNQILKQAFEQGHENQASVSSSTVTGQKSFFVQNICLTDMRKL